MESHRNIMESHRNICAEGSPVGGGWPTPDLVGGRPGGGLRSE